MSLAHLTLATRDVEKTARFLEQTLGYGRDAVPENVMDPAVWLNIGHGQQIHLTYVEGFAVSITSAKLVAGGITMSGNRISGFGKAICLKKGSAAIGSR